MRILKIVASFVLVGLVTGGALGLSVSAGAEAHAMWKMQSAFPIKLAVLGEAVRHFEARIAAMSSGTLQIKAYEPNALVPPLEALDAVKAGSIDAMWGASVSQAGKVPRCRGSRRCRSAPAPAASGWFRKEITSVEDLKGLEVRYGGLGAKVLTKLGASTQRLAPGHICVALERGVIDAAEFSMPAIDQALGFHEVAKHYYFPGWHQ
ncbi:MAG: hypothetical protein V3V17_06935 [Alphaproteobacteria bacterium]